MPQVTRLRQLESRFHTRVRLRADGIVPTHYREAAPLASRSQCQCAYTYLRINRGVVMRRMQFPVVGNAMPAKLRMRIRAPSPKYSSSPRAKLRARAHVPALPSALLAARGRLLPRPYGGSCGCAASLA